jgi:predicted RNA-binding protein YlqC (UPF0109 family)
LTVADSSEQAADFVIFLAKSIVTDPDAVKVTTTDGGRTLELETADEDRGRVIGRQGRVAKAMRALLAVSSSGSDLRLEIVD